MGGAGVEVVEEIDLVFGGDELLAGLVFHQDAVERHGEGAAAVGRGLDGGDGGVGDADGSQAGADDQFGFGGFVGLGEEEAEDDDERCGSGGDGGRFWEARDWHQGREEDDGAEPPNDFCFVAHPILLDFVDGGRPGVLFPAGEGGAEEGVDFGGLFREVAAGEEPGTGAGDADQFVLEVAVDGQVNIGDEAVETGGGERVGRAEDVDERGGGGIDIAAVGIRAESTGGAGEDAGAGADVGDGLAGFN